MIYFAQRANGDIKIGYTKNVGDRLITLKRQHGDLQVLGVCEGDRNREHQLHEHFSCRHLGNEWFSPSAGVLEFLHDKTKPHDKSNNIDNSEFLDTVRSSATMDDAAKQLRVSRYTIIKRLEALGLRAKSVLLLERIQP